MFLASCFPFLTRRRRKNKVNSATQRTRQISTLSFFLPNGFRFAAFGGWRRQDWANVLTNPHQRKQLTLYVCLAWFRLSSNNVERRLNVLVLLRTRGGMVLTQEPCVKIIWSCNKIIFVPAKGNSTANTQAALALRSCNTWNSSVFFLQVASYLTAQICRKKNRVQCLLPCKYTDVHVRRHIDTETILLTASRGPLSPEAGVAGSKFEGYVNWCIQLRGTTRNLTVLLNAMHLWRNIKAAPPLWSMPLTFTVCLQACVSLIVGKVGLVNQYLYSYFHTGG